MPVVINDQTYYRTAEACWVIGISKNTLFRWLKEEIFSDVEYRDWRGWRLFTEEDLNKIQAEATRIEIDHVLVNPREKGV